MRFIIQTVPDPVKPKKNYKTFKTVHSRVHPKAWTGLDSESKALGISKTRLIDLILRNRYDVYIPLKNPIL